MRQIDEKKTTLPNGLRVITVYKDSDIFSLEVGIKVGSLYENEANSGISHMVEHMLFKGTANRNTEMLSCDIEKLAGDVDIYTTYDQTVLTANVMKEKAGDCMEIVSDMLMNAAFPRKEFYLEKKVIIEEIKMNKNDLEDFSYLELYKAAFPDRWYKYHIAGTIRSVKSIKLDALKEFYRQHYAPNNTVICVVSSYTHEDILAMVEGFFKLWNKKEPVNLVKLEYNILPQKAVKFKKGIEQAHILYGFDIQHLDRREQIALALLNRKIGGGANSILFRELRDKKGYAYNVYSDLDTTRNISMFYIYTAVSKENYKNTLSIIDDVIYKLRDEGPDFNESSLNLIKNIFKTDTAIAIESSIHIVDYLLDGEMSYNNPLEFENVLSIMDTIDVNEMQYVIGKILKDPIVYILSPK